MSSPGDVYFLPPVDGERLDLLKGDRPHVLLNADADRTGFATLAYASTKETEAVWGAAHLFVDPDREGRRETGLSRPTYVYPSRLISYELGDLPERSGRLIRPLPLLRRTLAAALGLGTGVTKEPNRRGANRRGRIAQLADDASELLGTTTAVVVTEPAYSRTSRYQTLVPILSATEFEPADLDVVVRNPGWPGSDGTIEDALLAVSLVASVFDPSVISGYRDHVLDSLAMRRLDEALRSHFTIENK